MGAPTSSNLYGEPGPFGLQVSRGQIVGHTSISIFGYNPDLDQTEETVWANGGMIPHPTSASVLEISSTSANDASNGTGARTVYIEGLNNSYNTVSETVILNGQSAVSTQNSYLYVNAFSVLTVGSGGVNAGQIFAGTGVVTAGVPAVPYDVIGVGFNNRTTAHYCVPNGYTGYLVNGIFSSGQESGSTGVTGYLKQHGPDGILRVGAVTAINNGAVQYDFSYPYIIPEKNCIGATAIGAANNNFVSAFFNIVLIKNNVS